MTTAVVVATVVTTDLNEASLKDQLLEQIRRNDSDLITRLAKADQSANVATAILDLREFMEYATEWLRRREESAQEGSSIAGTEVVTDGMSELEFMEHTLQQLRHGETRAFVTLSDSVLEAMEEEQIGEHISRYPFQY